MKNSYQSLILKARSSRPYRSKWSSS